MQDWATDTFEVGCLGAATVTGIAERGLLTSVEGACRVNGKPVEFTAYWSVAPGGEMTLGAVAAGKRGPRGAAIEARDIDDLRDLVEECLRDWWGTEEAQALVAGNAAVDAARATSSRAAAAAELEQERAELRAWLAAPDLDIHVFSAKVGRLEEVERQMAAARQVS